MHLVEISIFSQNNVTVRTTKIMNRANILHRIFFLDRFDQFSTLKNDFENQNFEMFEEVFHNFGKSDGNII